MVIADSNLYCHLISARNKMKTRNLDKIGSNKSQQKLFGIMITRKMMAMVFFVLDKIYDISAVLHESDDISFAFPSGTRA